MFVKRIIYGRKRWICLSIFCLHFLCIVFHWCLAWESEKKSCDFVMHQISVCLIQIECNTLNERIQLWKCVVFFVVNCNCFLTKADLIQKAESKSGGDKISIIIQNSWLGNRFAVWMCHVISIRCLRTRGNSKIPLHFGVFIVYVVPNKVPSIKVSEEKRDRNGMRWWQISDQHTIVALPHHRRVNKFRCQQPMIIIKCISIFKIIQIVCVNKSCEIRLFFFCCSSVVVCKIEKRKNIVLCQCTSIQCNFMSFLARTRARAQPISEKKCHSFTFHCPQCFCKWVLDTALDRKTNIRIHQINDKERKEGKNKKIYKLKNEITYLFMYFICTKKNGNCTLLPIWNDGVHLLLATPTIAARFVCFCFSFWFALLLSLYVCRSMCSFKQQINSFVSTRFLWWLFSLSHCRTLFLLFMKWWWYTLHLHVLPLIFVSYEARKT